MTPEREQDVIRRVLRGDSEAFSELVAAYQKNVYNIALRLLGSREDAEDLTQETFLTAYRRLGDFRGESRFSTWLCRIASNACIDALRRRKHTDALSLTREDEDAEDAEWEIPDESLAPEALLSQKLTRDAVRRGLRELSPEGRQVLILRELEGMSYEEIGETLGLEPGTVKSRIFRARKKLCAFLLRDGNIPDALSSKTVEGGGKP